MNGPWGVGRCYVKCYGLRWSVNRWVFRSLRNLGSESVVLSATGSLFHSLGANRYVSFLSLVMFSTHFGFVWTVGMSLWCLGIVGCPPPPPHTHTHYLSLSLSQTLCRLFNVNEEGGMKGGGKGYRSSGQDMTWHVFVCFYYTVILKGKFSSFMALLFLAWYNVSLILLGTSICQCSPYFLPVKMFCVFVAVVVDLLFLLLFYTWD